MRLAVVAAGFTPGEADQLRRAMGAWRQTGVIEQFRKKLLDGMLANGLPPEFADGVFNQIRGFGEYGFPESHAASFALLVYVSAWLKHYHPALSPRRCSTASRWDFMRRPTGALHRTSTASKSARSTCNQRLGLHTRVGRKTADRLCGR